MPEEKLFKYQAKTGVLPPEFTTYTGHIRSTGPMAALEELVSSFANPSRVFSAEIRAPTLGQPVLARYLSARAATQEAAPSGARWREDGLYVDGKKVPERPEVYELVQQ